MVAISKHHFIFSYCPIDDFNRQRPALSIVRSVCWPVSDHILRTQFLFDLLEGPLQFLLSGREVRAPARLAGEVIQALCADTGSDADSVDDRIGVHRAVDSIRRLQLA